MGWNPQGAAQVDSSSPRAFGTCDRCGFIYNLRGLHWQYQWQGTVLQNLRILVCDECLDQPAEFLRTIVLPPDPQPLPNARPEPYASEESSDRATQAADTRITQSSDTRITQIANDPTEVDD